jgi:sugar lactone lactonase YvrE
MTERTPSAVQSTALATGLTYAESPRWHDGKIYISDVHDYKIKSIELDGTVKVVADVPGRPGGLGFLADGQLVVAVAKDRTLALVRDGVVEPLVDLSLVAHGMLNDMVITRSDHCYVGVPGFNLLTEKPRPGRLIMAQVGREPIVVSEEVLFPNGMAIDDEGNELFVAETGANRISRFTIKADGRLGVRRTWSVLSSGPDGMCLDAQGGAWAALLQEGRFVHINSDGDIDQSVTARGNFAVACATFGDRRDRLAMCSTTSTVELLANGTASSRVDELQLAIPGAGVP